MRDSWTWTVEDGTRLVVRYAENRITCSVSSSLVFQGEPDWESVAFTVEAMTNTFEWFIDEQEFTLPEVDVLVTKTT